MFQILRFAQDDIILRKELIQAMLPQLMEFARVIQEKTNEVRLADSKTAMDLQTALSVYMGEQMQILMGQGISVSEIQDVLRDAMEYPEQTYASDADSSTDDMDEQLALPINEIVYFMPVNEAIVSDFADGNLDPIGLMQLINDAKDIGFIETSEILDTVLPCLRKSPIVDDVISGGEIVADSDGEAFMPEHLHAKAHNGYEIAVCDPAVFKPAEETATIADLLNSIGETDFRQKSVIKSLQKAGFMPKHDKTAIKEGMDYLWDEFSTLRGIYRKAVELGIGMLIFVRYVNA